MDLQTLVLIATLVAIPSFLIQVIKEVSPFLPKLKKLSEVLKRISGFSLTALAVSAAILLSSFTTRKALEEQSAATGDLRETLSAETAVIYKVLSAAEAYQNGQFKEALNRYDLALEMTLGGPGKYYVLKKQGDCHRHLGEYVQAERSYREAVETSPEKDGARAGLAIALYRLNRFEEAQVEIEKIKKRNSTILYIHARIYAFWWIDKARFEKDELFEKARDLYSECQNYSLGSASPWCYYDEAALFSLRSRARNVSASEKAGLARQAVGLLDPALKKARENTESMYRQMRDRLVSDKDFDPIRDQEEFKDFLEEQGYTKIRSAVGRSDGGS